MRIYFLIFIALISCAKERKQSPVKKNAIDSQSTHEKEAFVGNIEHLKNDTVVINLKKFNYKILDIRLNDIDKRELVILKNNLVKYKVKILTGEDVQGFAVNRIKETSNGFEISTEFGQFYISKNFQFTYEKNSFFLTKIETHSIDYNNDNNIIVKVKIIKQPININDFKLEDFINE